MPGILAVDSAQGSDAIEALFADDSPVLVEVRLGPARAEWMLFADAASLTAGLAKCPPHAELRLRRVARLPEEKGDIWLGPDGRGRLSRLFHKRPNSFPSPHRRDAQVVVSALFQRAAPVLVEVQVPFSPIQWRLCRTRDEFRQVRAGLPRGIPMRLKSVWRMGQVLDQVQLRP